VRDRPHVPHARLVHRDRCAERRCRLGIPEANRPIAVRGRDDRVPRAARDGLHAKAPRLARARLARAAARPPAAATAAAAAAAAAAATTAATATTAAVHGFEYT